MTLALIILLVYNSATTIIKTVTVKTPSLERHQQLDLKYSETLTCPCTDISISYDKFLHISYQLHEVCSSDFVTDDWLKYLYGLGKERLLSDVDFRVTGFYAFQALRLLCQLANTTISNGLIRFFESEFISTNLIPSKVFQSQVQTFTNQFVTFTRNDFLTSLKMNRDTTQGNFVISPLQRNGYLYIVDWTIILFTRIMQYSGCSCGSTYACIAPSVIENTIEANISYTVPGFYIGCYILEALQKSSLECFYDQSCFDELKLHLSSDLTINATLLNTSLLITFSTKSTVGELLDNLMVEKWNWFAVYSEYYHSCHPVECTYTYKTRNDAIFIITTLLGLIGGLTTALKLIIPRFIRCVFYFYKRKQRVAPALVTVTIEANSCDNTLT